MREFFGLGGYVRPAEGYFSWQHLTFVTFLIVVMVIFAIFIGKRFKNATLKKKNKVLIASAILIDAFELFKIVLLCFRSHDPLNWLNNLPLFLCSIQLITIPMAAFCRGRLKEASIDFVMIFGLLGAVLGTYFAGQNYGCYPVLSFDNVVSGITHCISGFSSLYIMISGLSSMKKKNFVLTYVIFTGFCIAAYVANILVDYNYMFLMRGDGTPYDIIYNLVSGNKVLYPILVALLMFIYIAAYQLVYTAIVKNRCSDLVELQTEDDNTKSLKYV